MANASKQSRIPEDRLLAPQERDLIMWLIQHSSAEAAAFAEQVPLARVVSRCSCGCPTIDLAVGQDDDATTGKSQIVADYVGKTPEGFDVGVILWARNGQLSGLEIYDMQGIEGRFPLPGLETLKSF